MVDFDPEKQFIEDTEVIADVPEKLSQEVETPKDFTKYGLVATVAKNGMVLLWEWKPLSDARELANDNFKHM